ncbi:hypothetical protein ACH4TS_20565 [Streptomyces albidoflavus]
MPGAGVTRAGRAGLHGPAPRPRGPFPRPGRTGHRGGRARRGRARDAGAHRHAPARRLGTPVRGLDAWSWIEILTHSQQTTHRGRIGVRTHPLRQVLAVVERGYRGDEEYRNSFARLLAHDAERAGRPPLPAPGLPAWVGVGPLLWHSCTGGDMVVERHWLGP